MAKDTQILKSTLSAQELKQIQLFIDNPVLMEAVRKVLLYCLYNSGVLKKDSNSNPMTNFIFSFVQDRQGNERANEDVGNSVKIAWEAIRIIEAAFNDIRSLEESDEAPVEKINEAR